MHPFLIYVTLLPAVSSLLLYGCTLTENLCDESETCYPDGVFGQCYSPNSGAPPPTVIEELDEAQSKLLRLELTRLSNTGQEWPDARTQCVLAYFKLSIFYDLQYDAEFCEVRNPANIWALIQLIDLGLSEDPTILKTDQLLNDNRDKYALEGDVNNNEIDQDAPLTPIEVEVPDEDIEEILQQINEPPPRLDIDEVLMQSEEVDPLVEQYMEDIIRNGNPDLSALTDSQLNELISRLFILKSNLAAEETNVEDEGEGEAEEVVPLNEEALAEQQSVWKKDAEEVGEVNLGLDNTVHKIVKGRNSGIARVVGNRVYLKVNIKEEEQLYPLIEFLENTIALPNNLIFDDFQFDNGQLSMRISRFEGQKPKNEKRINTVEGVAQAVYKRRKDIARFSGAEVAETGIGIGEESVPVESTDRDWIFTPVLFVCAFTITALLTVLGVHVYKSRRYSSNNIQHMAENLEGKNSHAYQELCRQHMSHEGGSARGSKSSSTSSWCGEDGAPPNIDISTGHVILNFLQEYLSDPSRIELQWESISGYRNTNKHTTIAEQHKEQNRTVLPFDENLVPVDAWKDGEPAYINASFVYDDDPRQAVYMATQSPRGDDVAQFWQAVWQHGVCLIVNLSTMEETKQEKTYWPDTGSQVYGPFEIHLVSEHIWSDDYLVRSFYLKNLQSGETRTITQFHYLSWAKDSTPTSPKSLLEFRRKVNKSYRGRSTPVLVHSWDGAGRTGVYCAVDLLCARLLRGVRQLDVAASVEHLRDQRDGLVRTSDQFKLIYGSLAHEVSSLLKAIPQ